MSPLIRDLERSLEDLDPETTRLVEQLVRDALALAVRSRAATSAPASGWPEGYFEQTAGSLAGETFDRPDQGELPPPKEW